MGLDMMLVKKRKKDRFTEDMYKCTEEVIYWRKANAIHKYFVDNCQGGNDDCGFYPVSKEDIEKLYDKCSHILKFVKQEKGEVLKYSTIRDGKDVEVYREGMVIQNKEMCEEYLPTQSGFFFGNTEYNEYYLEDIKYTMNKLEDLLCMFDFENNELYYHSSW